MKYQELISKMTLEEKASFCSGKDFWNLKSLERLGIPEVMVSDGPHGLRKQAGDADHLGLNASVPATCFPTACATASSWDRELLEKEGGYIGEEALQEKLAVVLGPGANIKRSPLCGRNFEYFSEDPLLSGELAAAFINGTQSKGVGTSLKHYAANNQETRRLTIDSVVDERALREIYLTSFEIPVKKGKPWTVMNAYNSVNGSFCSENKELLTDILREEWGFEGLVMTDWGAEHNRVEGVKAGQHLEMPSSGGVNDARIVQAVKSGELDEKVLDESVDIVLDLIFKSVKKDYKYDAEEHHIAAREIAKQCMVLLKNEDGILPLSKTANIAVIGEMAKAVRYQGSGSSLINPHKIEHAYDYMTDKGIKFTYADGYEKKTDETNPELIEKACETAKNADVAVLFIGLTERYEAEGSDRTHIDLPKNQNDLVEAVLKVNPNVVIVLHGGAPVKMPWANSVKAILNAYLSGQASGGAAVDLLFGDGNPSGKLAETYPLELSDTPCCNFFPGEQKTVEYRESVYVGYRYYDTAKKDVLFPFGYGLSYTRFEYTGMAADKEEMSDSEELTVSVNVKNVGGRAGAEIVQLYIRPQNSIIYRPKKELKGFDKVYLEPGEEKTVNIKLNKRAFAYWNVNIKDWHVESGVYDILIGASSRDIRLQSEIKVNSLQQDTAVPDYREIAPQYYTADIQNIGAEQFEKVLGRKLPPVKRDSSLPFDMECTFEDLCESKNGRRIFNLLEKLIIKFGGGVMGEEEGMNNTIINSIKQMPLLSLQNMSKGVLNQKMCDGLLTMCNGNGFRGFFKILGAVPATIKGAKKLLG